VTTHPVFQRRGGVLLHVSSLPGRHGIGDLGPSALRFVDWLAAAGIGWWQMLPIGPVGPGNSPYSSASSFAIEPLYLSLETLAQEGWLPHADSAGPAALRTGNTRWAAARRFKEPRFKKACRNFTKKGGSRSRRFRSFEKSAAWLEEWLDSQSSDARDLERFLQFALDLQWSHLRAAAKKKRIQLLGDIPIFVGAGSAAVTSRPELFLLDRKKQPRVLTGCPPDFYNPDGQLWGHAHYAWKAHEAEDFAWWRARVRRQLELFDAVRIDHFIGFHRAWQVPAQDENAQGGKWVRARGRALLLRLEEELGTLPFVAEDLGAVTPAVHALRDEFDLPGMRVLQFGFGEDGFHRPHAVPSNALVATGTHDNDTTRGWWRGLSASERGRVLTYTGGSAKTVAHDCVRLAFATAAHTAVVPMQDLLELGSSARMNRPGTAAGNWRWRMDGPQATAGLARRLRALGEATERLPG